MAFVKTIGFDKVKRLLNKDLKSSVNEMLFDLGAFAERTSTQLIRQRIYGVLPSPTYRRTGRALGGVMLYRSGGDQVTIIRDTRLKGARKNYAPVLNINKKIKKFDSRFWDDTIKETQKEARRILPKTILAELKENL